eukprot:13887888-Alexandrium_andersonii.AAC.1
MAWVLPQRTANRATMLSQGHKCRAASAAAQETAGSCGKSLTAVCCGFLQFPRAPPQAPLAC